VQVVWPFLPRLTLDPVDVTCAVQVFRLGGKLAQAPGIELRIRVFPGEHVSSLAGATPRFPARDDL
jgi:hypothetical protein